MSGIKQERVGSSDALVLRAMTSIALTALWYNKQERKEKDVKHSISIEPGSSYRRILDIIQSEDGTAQSESLTDEHDGTNPYQLLTVISDKAISERTEAKIDAQQNVIVATFNIDE